MSTAKSYPRADAANFVNIPACMKTLPNWVVWRAEWNEKKQKFDKPPLDAKNGHKAKSNDPSTWSTYDVALARFARDRSLTGIGFEATAPYSIADIDDCIAAGVIAPWADTIVKRLDSYTECSPSNTGLRIVVASPRVGEGKRTYFEDGAFELYSEGQYLTITGNIIEGAPATVEPREAELRSVYELVFGSAGKKEAPHLKGQKIQYGQHRYELLRIAGKLRQDGLEEDAIYSALVEVCEKRCEGYGSDDKDMCEQLAASVARCYEPGAGWPEVAETLMEFNGQFYVVADFGGKCRVCFERPDPRFPKSFELVHQSFDDFRKRFMHQRVRVGETKEGIPVFQDRGSVWLRHKDRRQYDQVIYAPGQTLPANTRNLWRGFAYEPKKGDCSLYLAHLKEVVCQGKQDRYDWLRKWMAYGVRHPNEQGHTSPVLVGGQGTGKNSAAEPYANLWGAHCLVVTQKSQFTGHFNAHLRACSVLVVNEAFFAGDRSQAGPMKALITDPYLAIEAKGVDVVRARNLLHIIICSNEDWVVPADMDSRRFTVLRSSDEHREDAVYFAALHRQLENGGYGALLYHLLREVDLSNFNPRRILDTQELDEQKAHSVHGIDGVWLECLQRGCLPGQVSDAEPFTATLRGADLVDWAIRKRLRGWEFLRTEHTGYLFGENPRGKKKGLGYDKGKADPLDKGERVNVWWIPSLTKARRDWDERRFRVEWGKKGDWQIDKDWQR